MTLLDVQHIQKVYQTRFGATEVTALKDLSEGSLFFDEIFKVTKM